MPSWMLRSVCLGSMHLFICLLATDGSCCPSGGSPSLKIEFGAQYVEFNEFAAKDLDSALALIDHLTGSL